LNIIKKKKKKNPKSIVAMLKKSCEEWCKKGSFFILLNFKILEKKNQKLKKLKFKFLNL